MEALIFEAMNIKIQRSDENPILVPDVDNTWEAEATFNGCPAKSNGIIHFLYRAISTPQKYDGITIELSTIGYTASKDGVHFQDRRQFIYPEYAWEHYGCEDPRVTKIGGKYFIFYTALSTYPFSPEGIKVGLAITKDFQSIEEKHLVTHFNAKAMVLFPTKIGGLYQTILTVNTDKPPAKIAIASFNHIQQIWSPEYWTRWYSNLDRHVLHIPQTNNDHLEVGAPPVRTKFGWLLLYSHIENYFSPPATFGIRALLLDIEKPHRIIARTDQPLLISEASYERFGKVPDIVFPTGVIKNRRKLNIYYGAADTTCALASTNLSSIINNMTSSNVPHKKMDRYPGNPIIFPKQEHAWESKAVFNPAALYENGKVHIIYRAMSEDNTSVMGYAASSDGFTIDERLDKPIYVPREDFESKGVSNGNSGCEDPRLTLLEDTIYMLYTAYRGDKEPMVALTSISKDDFLNRRWEWSRPRIISPPGLADKDAALFPEKINGQFAILHRLGTNIWLDSRDDLDFDNNSWLGGKEIITPEDDIKGTLKVGIAGPPIKTDNGWLLLYHGVTNNRIVKYHLTAAILDLNNPTRVLAISDTPILEPEMPYEKEGIVSNVVFPCGNIIKDNYLIVYYGAADRVIGIASMDLTDLLNQTNS
jgi:predicted GH43/DUF377 family glycosyl hydrolase